MADLPTKFTVSLWNGKYYINVSIDGKNTELNSSIDLTFTQWQDKIKTIIDAGKPPEPNMCPMNNKECPNFRSQEIAKP